MMKRLLVPLDGDDAAETLLPLLRRLDGLGVWEITLLRTEMPVAVDEYAVVSEALLEEAKVFLERTRDSLRGLKARVKTLARIGPTVATTLEVADETDATLIVTAIHRGTRFQRFLFGSAHLKKAEQSRGQS